MVHGLLHLMGLTDATSEEKAVMRAEEDAMLKLFHVKQL
jgi:ssRNA-specific RNase YbeY (16S rRNA maturation enzyme)